VSFDPSEFIEWCRSPIANFKVPHHVTVVDDLPVIAAGKVRKFELRTMARELFTTPAVEVRVK
jgi:acyl-CoA synthetase (AMP-forming)/AMP-acid ligase II